MAIVRTRNLDALVSVFNRQSIEFTVPTGATTVTVTLTWDTTVTVVLTPLKTVTNVGLRDTYFLDLSDVLKYCMGFPDGVIFNKSLNIKIDTNADTANYDVMLCYAYTQLGGVNTVIYVYNLGTVGTIYHYGDISFYFKGAAGNYAGIINGVSSSYDLVTGYNTFILHPTHLLTGAMTFTATNLSLALVYKAAVEANYITWMDKNGALSSWSFRQLAIENDCTKTGEIPVYYQTQALTTEKSIESGRSKNIKYYLDTIALNETQYQQLVEIQDSLYVTFNAIRVKVFESSSRVASCKQNLNFKITLIQEAYAGNY